MAVYTYVSNHQLDAFLEPYDIGAVLSFKGIAEGVENSNYLLQTDKGAFIVTLYEKRVREKDLPFFLSLMKHFAGKGVRVARALPRKDGAAYGYCANKAATIFSFLNGRAILRPNLEQCAELGKTLALMHKAGADFKLKRKNEMGVGEWLTILEQCRGIKEDLFQKLLKEIERVKAIWPFHLPQGVIHGDLFPDNMLFDEEEGAGVIDFYFACYDILAYDLAICLNAWCWAEEKWDKDKAQIITQSYHQLRPLSADERAHLPLLCLGACLRFLLTRLGDQMDWDKRQGGNIFKSPEEYMKLLAYHQSGDHIYERV